MGQQPSLLTAEEIEDLQLQTGFTQKEIKLLYRRFMRLDKGQTGQISAAEFMSLPELAMNPLGPRMAQLLKDANFPQFLRVLSMFNERIVKEHEGFQRKHLEFIFRVYDIDDDGFISSKDLRTIIEMLVGDNIPEQSIVRTVERTIAEFDSDQDGKLSFDEFSLAFDDVQGEFTFKFFADD